MSSSSSSNYPRYYLRATNFSWSGRMLPHLPMKDMLCTLLASFPHILPSPHLTLFLKENLKVLFKSLFTCAVFNPLTGNVALLHQPPPPLSGQNRITVPQEVAVCFQPLFSNYFSLLQIYFYIVAWLFKKLCLVIPNTYCDASTCSRTM